MSKFGVDFPPNSELDKKFNAKSLSDFLNRCQILSKKEISSTIVLTISTRFLDTRFLNMVTLHIKPTSTIMSEIAVAASSYYALLHHLCPLLLHFSKSNPSNNAHGDYDNDDNDGNDDDDGSCKCIGHSTNNCPQKKGFYSQRE